MSRRALPGDGLHAEAGEGDSMTRLRTPFPGG
jgi:hypothetical protein